MVCLSKHLKKLIPILSIGGLITPIVSTTSCSCTFELNLTVQEQFVYDRTFSIMGKNDNQKVFGTGWIISDATSTNDNDYTYWLATNWHVTHGMENIHFNNMYYADNSFTNITPYIDKDSYLPFKSINIEPVTNFLYSGFISSYAVGAIDLSVVKVDFGTPTGAVKTKLDNLNTYKKEHGSINKFAKDSASIRSKDKIIGGYPMEYSGSRALGAKWEAHSFAGNKLEFREKSEKYDGTNCGHAIGSPYYDQKGNRRSDGSEDFPYWDISPQYMFKDNAGTSFMPAGASGSMMITADYEVCGIYWGGWSSTSGDDFYPSFSLFNTDEKNFLEKYI